MKFINKKRIASAALAGALALSMATPAFAASKDTTITGNYKAVTVAVTVPTTGKAIINPYGLPVQLDENSSVTGQQITTGAPLVIQNRSAVPLDVTASIASTVTSADSTKPVTLETAATGLATATDKKLNVKFEMFEADDLTATNIEDMAILNEKFSKLDSANAKPSSGNVLATGSAVAITTSILTLREGSADGTLQAGGAAFFRLAGSAAKKAPWVAEDGFTATISFTFEPSSTPFSRPLTAKAGATLITSAGTFDAGTGGTLTPAAAANLVLPAGVTPSEYKWAATDADAAKVTITVNDTTHVATVKNASGGAGSADIILTVIGSNGIPYVAAAQSVTLA